MNNFKYSFKEFKNSIFFKILITVQLIISLVLLYRVIEIKNYEKGKIDLINQITKDKKIYTFTSNYSSFQELVKDIETEGKFSKFSKDIQKKYDVVTAIYGEMFFYNFNGIENFIDKDIEKFNEDERCKPINSLKCSYNFFDVFNLKLAEGDFEEFKEFVEMDCEEQMDKVIPIVLGDSYKSVFKINEIIESTKNKYKVVGFLKKNQYFLDKGIYDANRAKNLNTFAIAPSSKDLIDKNLINSFIVVEKDKDDFNDIKTNIDNFIKLNDVKLSLIDPNQNIDEFVEMINYNVNIKSLIVYIIMAFIIIGIFVIFANRILARKKEFSIHIMHGATFKDIYIRILLEHLYPMFVAIIIAFIYIYKDNVQIVNETLNFDILAFLESSFILFLIIFFIALIPIYKIKKNKINYCIRGE